MPREPFQEVTKGISTEKHYFYFKSNSPFCIATSERNIKFEKKQKTLGFITQQMGFGVKKTLKTIAGTERKKMVEGSLGF